jgi:hypothetical protein
VKMRLGVVLGIAAVMVLLVSLAVGASSPGQPACSLPASSPLPALGETGVLTETQYAFLPLVSPQHIHCQRRLG